MNTIADLARAYHFAAVKHVDQRRKGAAAEPYMNHLTEAAELVAAAGADIDVVIAAVLHDTVEDTGTTPAELALAFGRRVADLVLEVTDDKSLPRGERKQRQIEHAVHLTAEAKLIKLADKIANLRAVRNSPPVSWSRARIAEYVDWAREVVAGCRGVSPWLEGQFDEISQRISAGK